jgi:hypothetical protein
LIFPFRLLAQDRIITQFAMYRSARPGIFFRFGDYFCPHRVPFNITEATHRYPSPKGDENNSLCHKWFFQFRPVNSVRIAHMQQLLNSLQSFFRLGLQQGVSGLSSNSKPKYQRRVYRNILLTNQEKRFDHHW